MSSVDNKKSKSRKASSTRSPIQGRQNARDAILFPQPFKSSGNGVNGSSLLQEMQQLDVKALSNQRFCNHYDKDQDLIEEGHSKEYCKFIHCWEDIKKPSDYNLLTDKKDVFGKAQTLTVWFAWGATQPEFQVPFSFVFPTKCTELWERKPKPSRDIFQVCRYFFFKKEKCDRWNTCTFIHMDYEKASLLCKSKFCEYGQECEWRPPKGHCPFAHHEDELRVPPTLSIDRDSKASARTVVFFQNDDKILERVSMKYLYQTQLPPDEVVQLCINDCDLWENCSRAHIHVDFWQDYPDTKLPLPTYYKPLLIRKSASNSTASTMQTTTSSQQNSRVDSASNVSDINPTSSDGQNTHTLQSYFEVPPPTIKGWSTRKQDPVHEVKSVKDRWVATSKRWNMFYEELVKKSRYSVLGPSEPHRILYHPNLLIGSGGSSRLYLGLKEKDGTEVAVKKLLDPEAGDQTGEEQQSDVVFENEIHTLKSRNCITGLVHYLDNFRLQNPVEDSSSGLKQMQVTNFILLELMEFSLEDLVAYWKSKDWLGTALHFSAVQYIIGSVLVTLRDLLVLHLQSQKKEKPLVHRDIKPGNIMLDRMNQVRLVDFGLAKEIRSIDDAQSTVKSSHTLKYAPPEALREQIKVHSTSDLFSLGLVLYYILVGEADWGGVGNQAVGQIPSSKGLRTVIHHKRQYKRRAAEHWLENVILESENLRALFSLPSGQMLQTKRHEILLRHPFFWSARKCNNFLVSLGNYIANCNSQKEKPSPALQAVAEHIESVVSKRKEKHWSHLIDQSILAVFVPEFDKTPITDRPPLYLLVFIRNCYIHTTNDSNATQLLKEPYFLYIFPSLVVQCWQACIISPSPSIPPLETNPNLQPTFAALYKPSYDPYLKETDPWI